MHTSSVTLDQEGEREQEDIGDGKSRDEKDACSGSEALVQEMIEGRVGGEVRRNKGDFGIEGGVD